MKDWLNKKDFERSLYLCENIDELLDMITFYKGMLLENPKQQQEFVSVLLSNEFQLYVKKHNVCSLQSLLNMYELVSGCFDYFNWYKELAEGDLK